MSKIFTTTLRLNLEREADRRAFDYLRRMDKRQFRSYSGAIVTAVNAYFGEQERIAANPGYQGWGSKLDPHLETNEREEAFFQRVTEAVVAGLRSAVIIPVQQTISTPAAPTAVQTSNEADLSAALDFADSF